MALLTERANDSGIPENYTKINKASFDGGRVTVGLKHYTSLQARIDGKSPVNRDSHEVVNIPLSAEERATIDAILYAGLKRVPGYEEAVDQDPDEWKLANQE